MSNLTEILNVGTGNAWLFAPSAILLGALHGLEPGHSKTMMAAFIVAIRGTVTQAILLGLAATLSHTAIVWVIALGGLYFGSKWTAEGLEPYLQIVSGALIIGVAGWMAFKNWRDHRGHAGHAHPHDDHEHDHHAHDHDHDHHHDHDHVMITRIRMNIPILRAAIRATITATSAIRVTSGRIRVPPRRRRRGSRRICCSSIPKPSPTRMSASTRWRSIVSSPAARRRRAKSCSLA